MKKIYLLPLLLVCLCFNFGCGLSSNKGNNTSGSSDNVTSKPIETTTGETSNVFRVEGSSIYAKDTNISGDITIPETFNGQTITTIPENAFKGCAGITSIIVPNTVTKIGMGAFNGCIRIASITLPFVGNTAAGGSEGKDNFGYIFGTNSYTGGIQTEQYYNSTYSKKYYIPSGLRSVKITNAAILGYCAFQNCSMLTTIDLNDDILAVNSRAFQNCSQIRNINLPNIIELKNSLFSGCTNLEKFTINEKVTTIGEKVFYNCMNLKRVNSAEDGVFVIPNTITSIGLGAFNGCIRISSITLPFVGNTAEGGGEGKAHFGYIFGKDNYTGAVQTEQYYNSVYSSKYYIPNGLRSVKITNANTIGYGAFQNCSMITQLEINSSAKDNVGTKAFSNCVSPKWF